MMDPPSCWRARRMGASCTARRALPSLDGQNAVSLSDAEAALTAAERVWSRAAFVRSAASTRARSASTPAAPFTTSSLQQEASRKLGFTTAKTMQVAQQLYEGVDLEGARHAGPHCQLHPYGQRAPVATRRSPAAARGRSRSVSAATIVPEKPNVYKGRQSAQDAHEAIRPAERRPARRRSIKASLTTRAVQPV